MPVSKKSLHGHRLPEAFMNTHHHVPLPIITIMTSDLPPKKKIGGKVKKDDCITLWVTKRVDCLQFDWMARLEGLDLHDLTLMMGVPTVTRR